MKRHKFLEHRVARAKRETAGDPLAETKLAYVFNALATKLLPIDYYRLADIQILGRLVPEALVDDESRLDARARRTARLEKLFDDVGRDLCTPPRPTNPLKRNLGILEDFLGLDAVESQIVLLAIACKHADMREVLRAISVNAAEDVAAVVSDLTALPVGAVREALRPAGLLRMSGLISIRPWGPWLDDRLLCDRHLWNILAFPRMTREHLLQRFVESAPPPSVAQADFAHLSAELGRAINLLRTAVAERTAGVNLLLYGPTGVGKSELARVLAVAIGVPLLLAGASDEAGNAPSARERLASLLIGNRVAARGLGILLFDELEDLFSSRGLFGTFGDDLFESRGPPSVSKQWVNMLLESNAVPTIWIANSVAAMEHSFLRRFTYVIELGDFTAGQRRRAWQRHLQPADDVSADDLEALVQRFELSPAHISSAVRAARLMSPTALKRPVLEAVLEPAMKLRHGSRPAAIAFEPHRYLLEVVNTPVDLEALARKLASWTPGSGKGLTLCFHGPSGTGKSELARYLAHRMERPLVVRRGSDIISCWVGATEQNISRAFRQAHQDGAVLLFDEADSFLRNRRGAIRSWEVTHVNEFLQQLELFPGAVICTTNRFEDLDPAVHRRFLFKIPFGYLLPEQSTFLFRRTLEALGAPATGDLTALAAMAAFDTLAPGDFDAVERRLRVMGAKPTAKELLDELRQEIEVKRGVQETGTPSQFDARRSGMT